MVKHSRVDSLHHTRNGPACPSGNGCISRVFRVFCVAIARFGAAAACDRRARPPMPPPTSSRSAPNRPPADPATLPRPHDGRPPAQPSGSTASGTLDRPVLAAGRHGAPSGRIGHPASRAPPPVAAATLTGPAPVSRESGTWQRRLRSRGDRPSCASGPRPPTRCRGRARPASFRPRARRLKPSRDAARRLALRPLCRGAPHRPT